MMLGAIIGDIVGSPYEFDRGEKSKKFPLFSNASRFTDDSVMTIAVEEKEFHPYWTKIVENLPNLNEGR